MKSRVFHLLLPAAIVLTAGCSDSRRTLDEGTVERVLVIGIDGLDWRVLDPLMAAGRTPNLARMVDRGVRADLVTLNPAYSPVIWTSVATGKLPHKHGITAFATDPDAEGRRTPLTSNARTARTLWSVLGDLGRRVAVVGWWTTWPAEAVQGVLVSDRMLYNRFNLWLGAERAGADLPAQTHPPELFEELVDLTRAPAGLEDEFFERFCPQGPRPQWSRDLHDPWYELLLVYARDRAYAAMLERILARDDYGLVAYYLNGPDIASHYFWKYLFPDEWPDGVPRADVERFGEVIPRYYEYVDGLIAPLLEQADGRTVVVVLSDHGFTTGRREDSPHISGTHYRTAPPGVLVMAGGGLPSGITLERATVMDLTPTLLHLLGHPVAEDMDGRVLPVAADSIPGRPVRSVATYETEATSRDAEPRVSTYDDAIIERLRALGYLESAP